MIISFKKWLETEDPVAAWKNMRTQAGWPQDVQSSLTGEKNPQDLKRVQVQSLEPNGNNSRIPPEIINTIQNGFRLGGVVPDYLVKFFDLNNRNRSFVADSILYARGNAYPFYKEKVSGKPTGKFVFVPGYPAHKFMTNFNQ